MGGGGGGGGYTGDVSKYVEEAKKLMSTERKNVFISFDYEDVNEVNLLRGQSKNEFSDIAFNDWSVSDSINSERAEYIMRQIRERIERCSVTVVYVTDKTADSEWVNWEIEESVKLNKKVIAVHKGASKPTRLPRALRSAGAPVVSWSNLAAALKKL
jgi:hypothetical protein